MANLTKKVKFINFGGNSNQNSKNHNPMKIDSNFDTAEAFMSTLLRIQRIVHYFGDKENQKNNFLKAYENQDKQGKS